jgi:hypothetical protein
MRSNARIQRSISTIAATQNDREPRATRPTRVPLTILSSSRNPVALVRSLTWVRQRFRELPPAQPVSVTGRSWS